MKEFKKLRLKAGMSLRKLGELAGVPYCNIRDYEDKYIKTHKLFASYLVTLGKSLNLTDSEIVGLLKKYSK